MEGSAKCRVWGSRIVGRLVGLLKCYKNGLLTSIGRCHRAWGRLTWLDAKRTEGVGGWRLKSPFHPVAHHHVVSHPRIHVLQSGVITDIGGVHGTPDGQALWAPHACGRAPEGLRWQRAPAGLRQKPPLYESAPLRPACLRGGMSGGVVAVIIVVVVLLVVGVVGLIFFFYKKV